MNRISLTNNRLFPFIFRVHTLIFVIVVAAAVGFGVLYKRYEGAQNQIRAFINNPTELTKAEVKVVTEEVGKLISLPEGEAPTITTVTDLDRVKDQPFFVKAEYGDKVLIYTQAKKAILYRPSNNKVVDVGAVNIAQQEGPQAEQVAGVKTDQKPEQKR